MNYVENKINNCSEGTNQIEVDDKVLFDNKTKTLIFYNGENENKSLKKWILPLNKFNIDGISYENIDFPYLKFKSDKKLVKYYENEIENDSLNQFVYPIYEYCFKKNDIEQVISIIKNEIKIAK